MNSLYELLSTLTTADVLGLAALAGVASHVLYFHVAWEHHMYSVTYFLSYIGALLLTGCLFYFRLDYPLDSTFLYTFLVSTSYLTGLFASLLTFRLFLHPLNTFPGPIYARISTIWLSTKVGKGYLYKRLNLLHAEYGDFVRVGSSDLSCVHPAGIEVIYGARTKCTKAPSYDYSHPFTTLHGERNLKKHAAVRRVWAPGFTDKSIFEYESRAKKYRLKLVEQLGVREGQPVSLPHWINLYSFDVMGDLAFGHGFGMLDSSEAHWAIKLLFDGLDPLKFRFPIWLFKFAVAIPILPAAQAWWRFFDYCIEQCEERAKTTPEVPDIMSHLLLPSGGKVPSDPEDCRRTYGESQLIIVAGSDTTSATMTNVLYELCRDPSHITLIRAEIAEHAGPDGEVKETDIHKLTHLSAVITEALRLHPVIPSGAQRLTPPEGITVADTFIPGGMTVSCPQYAIGRSEDNYVDAELFIPERWTTRPELVKRREAYNPFSLGRFGCIGKPLALMNVRMTVSKLVDFFDIEFAPGETGRGIREDTVDHFTISPGECMVVFRKREM